MIDFAHARRTMVDTQLRPDDVTHLLVIEAFLSVPRENFVPEALRDLAYIDRDLPLPTSSGAHRAMMTPLSLAKILNALEVKPGERVLVIGAGTGYSAAVLAHIGAEVVALEEDDGLVETATAALAAYDGVEVVKGSHEAGAKAKAPYDVILVDGAVEMIPDAVFAQLKSDGRLGTIVIEGRVGRGCLFEGTSVDFSRRAVFDGMAPRLPGFARPHEFVF